MILVYRKNGGGVGKFNCRYVEFEEGWVFEYGDQEFRIGLGLYVWDLFIGVS